MLRWHLGAISGTRWKANHWCWSVLKQSNIKCLLQCRGILLGFKRLRYLFIGLTLPTFVILASCIRFVYLTLHIQFVLEQIDQRRTCVLQISSIGQACVGYESPDSSRKERRVLPSLIWWNRPQKSTFRVFMRLAKKQQLSWLDVMLYEMIWLSSNITYDVCNNSSLTL